MTGNVYATGIIFSGTAKGGRPWRGSVKIEPGFFSGFFSRFFKNPEKNPVQFSGKNCGKNPVKTRKKPVGKGGEYAESWGSGDVLTDRGRTTHVPARGKTRKKPGSIFHRPPPHRPLLAGADFPAVNKRGRPSKWPPECLPSKFADVECAFSL